MPRPARPTRPFRSRAARATWLAAPLAAAACGQAARVSPDDRAQLADGARLADSLTSAQAWDDRGVVALGYLERLRLGLGSPFRLAEEATGDTRLTGTLGRRVAWALLSRTLHGEAFAVDSAALGTPTTAAVPGALPDGGWHRALIDSAVRAAPSARTGEEAVRIAYALARAEGLVPARVAQAAVHAAALARDRRLAVADAERLLAASRTRPAADALAVLRDWRVARRFWAEMPLLADGLRPDAPAAVTLAEGLLARMRREGVITRAAAPDTVALPAATASTSPNDTGGARVATLTASAPAPAAAGAAPSITATPAARRDDPSIAAMPLGAAQRLAVLPSARAAYPVAPVVVTLGGYHHALAVDTLTSPGAALDTGAAAGGRARARLVTRARTEELLAAEWAVARGAVPAGSLVRREMAALVQATAVALRPWAQAPAIGVAVGAPVGPATGSRGADAEVDALRARDGYRAIFFDPGTPPVWRAAAARQLGDAVADLRGVFPALTLDGLTVRVGDSPRHDLALALHEPASRTVFLPPGTGAGTVAHELVHDLDWQAARDQLAVRGGYGTDRLARSGRGTLAQAVRGLAGARAGVAGATTLSATPPGTVATDLDRPAERLARGADFFVAAALARDGRANGVLSVVQDPVLAGYAGVVAPEPGDGAAEALVEVLGAATPLAPGARAWYLARFGADGVRSALSVAQFALGALPAWDAERVLRGVGVPGGLATPAATTEAVGACGGVGGGAAAAWQPRLLWLAADARARGFVRARGLHAAAAGSAFWGWTARGLLGGPWLAESADPAVARVRDAILRAAAAEARRASGGCAVLAPYERRGR